MNKQKFLDFIKSLTFGKLLRWGIKSGIFLWGALLIIFAPKSIYNIAQSYNDRWYDFGKGDYLDPKKYIWFIVPLQFFKVFLSCYFISEAWHRKNILYLFIMFVIFFIVSCKMSELDYYLRYATTFWH